MTNPFRTQPPVVIVKHERSPGLMDWACACGCGIPAALFIIGLALPVIQRGLGLG